MAAIETFLFDMDGVLCAYAFDRRLRLVEERLGGPASEIEAKIFTSGFEEAADFGEFGTAAYLEGVSERLGLAVDAATWLAARRDAMTPDAAMLDLARDLAERHPTALLTNNGWFLCEAIDEVFPALRGIFAERMFFSAEIGGGKEQTATFRPFLDRLGWRPETTLFIDDSATYIGCAREAGLETHLFAGLDGLMADLRARSIL